MRFGRALHPWYLLVVAAMAVSCTHASRYEEFAATSCPVSFRYPSGWRQHMLANAADDGRPEVVCTLTLDPPDWQWLRDRSEFDVEGDHAIGIEVTRQAFAEAAEDAGLSPTDDGHWQIDLGRLSHPLAEPISTPYASGVRGYVSYRVFRKNGGGVYGTAESSLVLLSNGTYSAVITADPLADSAAFEMIVQSLKFANPADKMP